MKTILFLDEKNYDEGLDLIKRYSVKGIIFINGKLLMI